MALLYVRDGLGFDLLYHGCNLGIWSHAKLVIVYNAWKGWADQIIQYQVTFSERCNVMCLRRELHDECLALPVVCKVSAIARAKVMFVSSQLYD